MPQYIKKRIITLICSNILNSNLSVEFIAKNFGYSSSYLREICWLQCKASPSTLIENVKLEKAIHLLLVDDLKIYDVCQRAGYKNVKTFRNQFKKRLSVTPSEFRTTLQNCINLEQIVEGFKDKLWNRTIGNQHIMGH